MTKVLEVTVPIRTVSLTNVREHWAKKARRTKTHRAAARFVCANAGANKLALPAIVTITRIAPRALDMDNLCSATKATQDGIADALGVDDRDPRVRWRYEQRKGKPREYAVEIRIETTTDEQPVSQDLSGIGQEADASCQVKSEEPTER